MGGRGAEGHPHRGAVGPLSAETGFRNRPRRMWTGGRNPQPLPLHLPSRQSPAGLATTKESLHFAGPVAQLGERFHGMEEVVGSSPIRSTRRALRFSRTLARSCRALHLVSTLPKVPPDDHIYPIETRRTHCLHRTGKLGRRRSAVCSPSIVLDCRNTGVLEPADSLNALQEWTPRGGETF